MAASMLSSRTVDPSGASPAARIFKMVRTVPAPRPFTVPPSLTVPTLSPVRTRTGERVGTVSDGGTVNGLGAGTVRTILNIRAAGLAPDGSTVRLDNMEAAIHWPSIDQTLSLSASVDVKEGQKVVVGRIGLRT